MSSTGRGADVDALGRYYTPFPLALAAVSALPIERWTNILEPGVGSGSWARAVQLVAEERGHPISLELLDVDPCAPGLMGPGADEAAHRSVGDFLHFTPHQVPDLVVGNPPYSLSPAEARRSVPWVQIKHDREKPIPVTEFHVRRALHLTRPSQGSVVFLLPHNVLGGKERTGFWERFPARSFHTAVPRPSFTPDGSTDSVDYAVFWWDWTHHGATTWGRLPWEREPRR